MAARAMFVLLAQALFIQSALCQNCGRTTFSPAAYNSYPTFGYDGFSTGLASSTFPGRLVGTSLTYNGLSNNIINAPVVEIMPTSGGALPVTSASPIAPNSIVVESENVYEGTLSVAGELPFVGTVGMEGDLPTIGSGAVNHACGNGAIGMISQDALVNNIGTRYTASAFENMYGNIGGFSNPVLASPIAYNAGLAGISYPAATLAGSYPAIGYTSGLASDVMGPTYDGIAYPAAGLAGAGLAGSFGLASGLGYDGIAYPAAGLAGAGLAGSFGLASGLGYDGLAYPGAAGYGSGVAAYGGAGEGNVAVAGELPVAGNTALYGQVPIMGAVSFSGPVAASGAVTIIGKCACGCGFQYLF